MKFTIEPLLDETFAEDEDVYGVVMYALSSMKVSHAIVKGLALKADEMTGISPQEVEIMRKYDNGLVTNRFYQENFAPIKAQIAVAEIKFRSMGFLSAYHKTGKGNDMLMQHVKAIMLTYLDIFTTIAMMWKGVEFAEKFDVLLRQAYELTPQQVKFFKDNGVM